MRKLGEMEHDECAPWCDHDPERHTEDCQDSYCDSYECWEKEHRVRLVAGPETLNLHAEVRFLDSVPKH